ncbi:MULTISPECIES: palindromic element RPE4 domain-containing protein [unclassified Rickettsia]|uniref:palindromic element RPE4 domain-containing protein n=1 Tax=unclassified Rickettsia TaxID=114295 RepID=UPI0031331E99
MRATKGVVAWLIIYCILYYGYYYGVMPWLDHGIQSFTKIFLDTVVKPRYDKF